MVVIKMSAQENLDYLKDINSYFALVPPDQSKAAYFEKLIAKTISEIYSIQFFSSRNDDPSVKYRLIWNGDDCHQLHVSPEGGADAIARCHNYFLIIEATLKGGANQWTQEYGSSIRHLDAFIQQEGCDCNQAYVLLVTPKISTDTYESIKSHPRGECKFIPIELASLHEILATSITVFTMKHLEIRRLLVDIPQIIRNSGDLDEYRILLQNHIIEWKKELFRREANTIIGLKSYEAMKKMNRKQVGESEILQELEKSDDVKQYLAVIGKQITPTLIEESLVTQSLTAGITKTWDGEKFFHPIPYIEYKHRACNIICTVKNVNQQLV
jgi:hypothetical protein